MKPLRYLGLIVALLDLVFLAQSCSNLLIDDWQSQSRLTFLYYNAMLQPSSDDLTMKSIIVGQPSPNHVTIISKDPSSYLYSSFGCLDATKKFGGISLRIKASPGFTVTVEMIYECGSKPKTMYLSSDQLGWTFNGNDDLYSIAFDKYTGIDASHLSGVLFSGMAAGSSVSFGPMAFYCGSNIQEYFVTTSSAVLGPSSTVTASVGTAPTTVIDTFFNKDTNSLGFWHGADDDMRLTWGSNQLGIVSTDPDYSFYTQVSGGGCTNIQTWNSGYLHISYSGTTAFTVSLQQHNDACNDGALPYPATWDSLEATRYASANNIYMPLAHFNIDKTRAIGFSLHGFYKSDPLTLYKVEIVDSVPDGFTIPEKIPSGRFVFQCKRPNSFAFAIDDGDPALAQQVLQIIKEEDITVTFFTVGAPLLDPSTNLSNVYKEMLSHGHQLALHSYTHPKMEGLPSYEAIDWEYQNDLLAVQKTFGPTFHTPYFRPPFGTEGARMRQRLGLALNTSDFYIVEWSVDVEDWKWALSPTPEKQLDAFRDAVGKGGDLVVMHYLYASTVGYFREFVRMAKETGKRLMRVDQCMMDPRAPPL